MAEGQDLSLPALRVTVFQESVIEIDLTLPLRITNKMVAAAITLIDVRVQ